MRVIEPPLPDHVSPWVNMSAAITRFILPINLLENDYYGQSSPDFPQTDRSRKVQSESSRYSDACSDRPYGRFVPLRFFIGDYIGVAVPSDADHGRAYFGFTGSILQRCGKRSSDTRTAQPTERIQLLNVSVGWKVGSGAALLGSSTVFHT